MMEQGCRTERKPSVLLVEDEALILEMVSEALAESGFEVIAFGSAEAALRCLDTGAEVDVLFTDINLPAMDGLTLAVRARQIRPALAVVYASGRVDRLSAREIVPGSRFVPKPYDTARVCNLLGYVAAHH